MKKYKDVPVLVMYDIRGIQNYIFATNKIVDIIGASKLVENIIVDGIQSVLAQNGMNNDSEYIVDWETTGEVSFLKDESVKMQVLFIGGGNAYVLFRTGAIGEVVSRGLGKYVLEHSYSLTLAVAVVEKSNEYMKNYDEINRKMRKIKSMMAPVKPIAAMPFMQSDSKTGYPLVKADVTRSGELISTETVLKRQATEQEKGLEKILDNMVLSKGDNSTLALIHIDGNSMGNRIKEIMKNKCDYADAVSTMRSISQNIKQSFLSVFDEMCRYMDSVSEIVKPNAENALYRRIVTAGDDITFICNPILAIPAVEFFLKKIGEMDMYCDPELSPEENHGKYGFSACAGIAFFYSHFPFSDAYEVAEACCSSAKKMAKQAERRNNGAADGMIGAYLDYQICTTIRTAKLEEYREYQYGYAAGNGRMIKRPYFVRVDSYREISDLEERNKDQCLDILFECLALFTDESKIARSKSKDLRNAYSIGTEEVRKMLVFFASRGIVLDESKIDYYYDALEIMDFFKGGIRYDENQN